MISEKHLENLLWFGKNSMKRIIMRKAIKFIIYKVMFPLVYNLGAIRRIKKKTVFIELQGRELSDNFVLLRDALEDKDGLSIVEFYLDYQKDSISYYKRCMGLLWEISDAAYLFINDSCNVLGAFQLRKGSKLIQTWHACGALKKWGFSVANQNYGESYQEMVRYPYHKNYSLVTVSSPEVAWAYAEAFGVSMDKIKSLGVSRTDLFFQKKFQRKAEEQYSHEVPTGKKVILYVPTFRGDRAHAASPEILDYMMLKQSLGDEYVFIEKRHPFVTEIPEVPEVLKDFWIANSSLSIEELLYIADICITDYSSVIFEYALFERPMLFLAYDMEEYLSDRGFYYEYSEFVPGSIITNTEELLKEIDKLAEFKQETIQRVRDFKSKYMSSCDGKATERILQEVLENEYEV